MCHRGAGPSDTSPPCGSRWRLTALLSAERIQDRRLMRGALVALPPHVQPVEQVQGLVAGHRGAGKEIAGSPPLGRRPSPDSARPAAEVVSGNRTGGKALTP